jgi:hypothetical protein
MTGFATGFATSILTISIGLYFGIILALFGLLFLAGSVGQWFLARTWFPALFEHLGIVVALIGIVFRQTGVVVVGMFFVSMALTICEGENKATLNRAIEAPLLASALVSVCVLGLVYGIA